MSEPVERPLTFEQWVKIYKKLLLFNKISIDGRGIRRKRRK